MVRASNGEATDVVAIQDEIAADVSVGRKETHKWNRSFWAKRNSRVYPGAIQRGWKPIGDGRSAFAALRFTAGQTSLRAVAHWLAQTKLA